MEGEGCTVTRKEGHQSCVDLGENVRTPNVTHHSHRSESDLCMLLGDICCSEERTRYSSKGGSESVFTWPDVVHASVCVQCRTNSHKCVHFCRKGCSHLRMCARDARTFATTLPRSLDGNTSYSCPRHIIISLQQSPSQDHSVGDTNDHQ